MSKKDEFMFRVDKQTCNLAGLKQIRVSVYDRKQRKKMGRYSIEDIWKKFI